VQYFAPQKVGHCAAAPLSTRTTIHHLNRSLCSTAFQEKRQSPSGRLAQGAKNTTFRTLGAFVFKFSCREFALGNIRAKPFIPQSGFIPSKNILASPPRRPFD